MKVRIQSTFKSVFEKRNTFFVYSKICVCSRRLEGLLFLFFSKKECEKVSFSSVGWLTLRWLRFHVFHTEYQITLQFFLGEPEKNRKKTTFPVENILHYQNLRILWKTMPNWLKRNRSYAYHSFFVEKCNRALPESLSKKV